MKVLFAVNNDNISDAIIKEYQKNYKEIISYKNVYYFNAILKELQKDKTYDRVVISEDLEPFANNNFDTIDKFLFEKLDNISDEATKANGENIEIILICTDRRSQSDEMLTKMFGIGIYNALIGDERTISNLCKLMYQPRTKKEAKIAYKIDGTNISYQAEDENNVSEAEVQNILAHYKRLGKNEDKYVDSFNNIVGQYTDTQLKIIIRYLPINVKAVLEERSPKYRELANSSIKSNRNSGPYVPRTIGKTEPEEKIKVKMLSDEKDKITRPIVIPSSLNNKKIVKLQKEGPNFPKQEEVEEPKESEVDLFSIDENETEPKEETTPKKGRGRPRKNPVVEEQEDKPKRGRGRPKKAQNEDVDLFNLNSDEDEPKEDVDLYSMGTTTESKPEETEPDVDLFNLDDEDEGIQELNNLGNNEEKPEPKEEESSVDLFNMADKQETPEEEPEVDLFNIPEEKEEEPVRENRSMETTTRVRESLNTLLTNEKKVVAFVGTTKNGTSFVVNNLALTLSSMNISTAILDTTQSKNAYYIFTKNEQQLRDVAAGSLVKLEQGIADGIRVDKNVTVYTSVPGEEPKDQNVQEILVTLLQNHDVVLIDADFNTPIEYYEEAQEIYLVQSMDILTIQPLTAFLRNLKAKNVLREEKLKIVINKAERVRSLSDKILIGGISSYNDPGMSFMTELFDKNNIAYCKIPFDVQNYTRYLDSLVNCEISLKGYTKELISSLESLANMVYPLINKNKYKPLDDRKNRMQFSSSTNDTLNRMRRNY